MEGKDLVGKKLGWKKSGSRKTWGKSCMGGKTEGKYRGRGDTGRREDRRKRSEDGGNTGHAWSSLKLHVCDLTISQ